MNNVVLTRALWPLGLVLCLMPFVSCLGAVEVVEEIVEQKYPCDPDATLSIHNTDGTIRVYGGDGSEISIQAIKKAYTSERLKSIVVDVKATRKSVAIETIFPPKKTVSV